MKAQAKFWDWIASRYSRQPVADEAAYEEKLVRTRRFIEPGCQLLEFGCGTGSTAIAHAPYVDCILATDISANMLAIAREKAAQAGLTNVSFEQAALRDLKISAEHFDVVMGMSVLHLLPDIDDDIARIHTLLKPGGIFVSSSPCIADMSVLLRFAAPLFSWMPFLPSIRVFSMEELVTTLQSAGFTIEESWQPGKDKALFIVARK